MIRKQVYIEARQEALLKQRARLLGITEAELIRRGLDRTLSEAGGGLSEAAWRKALELMQKRKLGAVPHRPWRREELYDRA